MSWVAPSGLTRKTIQTSRAFDDVRDPRVGTVAVGQPVEDPQRHLDAHVLVGVDPAVEQHLGLVLVDRHVVRDLGRPQLSPEVALTDREALDDAGVGGGDGRDLGTDLGVRVIALVAGRELAGGERSGRREQRQDQQAERQRGRGDLGETAGGHGCMVTR